MALLPGAVRGKPSGATKYACRPVLPATLLLLGDTFQDAGYRTGSVALLALPELPLTLVMGPY
jgi:arylsulfatase A-like enzyme